PERNRHFTGRKEILARIEKGLASGRVGLTQVKGISGLGGIGKTETALEFAYRNLGKPYQYAFWVRADAKGEIDSGFMEIARLLELPQKDAQNTQVVVDAARAWLERNGGWLLVFDNVEWDGQDNVHEVLPHGATGHVLVTTRAPKLEGLDIQAPIEIDTMTNKEAHNFLVERTGNKGKRLSKAERAAVDGVAQKLEYLPLALDQAAAYIVEKGCSFAEYLGSFETRHDEYLEFKPKHTKYPDTVATTWLMNFEQVEQQSEAARDLLYLTAFLDPDRIPLVILREGAAELGPALSTALANADTDPVALTDVLERLARYSIIRRDIGDDSYSIHRLVQDVVRAQLDKQAQRTWAERTVRAVNAAFPDPEFQHWSRCELLMPHARLAADHIERYDMEFLQAGRLLNQTAYYYKERARYDHAELLYKRALEIRKCALGEGHALVAISLNNLAALYRAQGRYNDAESLYQRAVEILQHTPRENYQDIAAVFNNLALLYESQGRHDAAETTLQQALEIRKHEVGEQHPDVAAVLNNLAGIYESQGGHDAAEPMYQRALEITKRTLGEDHPEVGKILNNLAELYVKQGGYDDAEPMFQRALEIAKGTLGEDDPAVATILDNLGGLYFAQGKCLQAELHGQRALEIRERTLPPDHPHLALSYANYAAALRALGREDEAAEYAARAEKIEEVRRARGEKRNDE
ncbi:MAG TPA: FxSxx-COOH system tetratricopeptide repeat protein, partial [Candidatus Bathyarchaeia archaeon]|nr:FxSxx-COOH system tetratricopeptide repeat protein [Candidatus Bathyarchaeia archaeon]